MNWVKKSTAFVFLYFVAVKEPQDSRFGSIHFLVVNAVAHFCTFDVALDEAGFLEFL